MSTWNGFIEFRIGSRTSSTLKTESLGSKKVNNFYKVERILDNSNTLNNTDIALGL
jgi:hypothetical protein